MAHLRPRYRYIKKSGERTRKVLTGYAAEFYDPARKPTRKYVSLRTKDKAEAMQRLTQYAREYAMGLFDPWRDNVVDGGLFLSEATRRFLDSRKKKDCRPKTLAKYESVLSLFADTLPPGFQLAYVEADHIQAFLFGGKLTDTSRHVYFKHLAVFFRWCASENLLDQNPLAKMNAPKQPKIEAGFLTVEQVEKLIRCIEADAVIKRYRKGEGVWMIDVIRFALSTGLRLNELIHLRWSDVLLNKDPTYTTEDTSSIIDYGWITVRGKDGFRTKSNHERRIPLVNEAWEILCTLQQQCTSETDSFVFKGVRSDKLHDEYVSKRFLHYRRLAKLPEGLSFHNLRHTCASWLVMRGVPLTVVQYILGHSTVNVTQRYAHLAPRAVQSEMQRAFSGL